MSNPARRGHATVRRGTKLDAIVTVADAKHLLRRGPAMLLLPVLSSISTRRDEMRGGVTASAGQRD